MSILFRGLVSRRVTGSPARDGSRVLLQSLFAGLAIGVIGWTIQQQRYRQALFHPRPFRRLAALGYLRAHPSVDSARLLHDYVQWESHALLRRRGRLVLRRMERILRA